MSPQVFTLPDLGEGLTEAALVRWLVAVGDTVAVDAPVAEVETAKAVVEVPSPYAGVIARLHGDEGATLQVGAPLVTVDGAGETYREEERAGSGNVLIGYGTSEPPPSRRGGTGNRSSGPLQQRTLQQRTADPAQPQQRAAAATNSGAAGRSCSPGDRPAVKSPIVRKLARDHGVDLAALRGTGPGGLIVRSDVQAAITAAGAPPPPEREDTDRRTGLPIRTRVPLTGLRRAVAENLSRSRSEIPEATTWVDVDATALLEFRAQLPDAPGLLAVLARFVVAGLARFPELNARVAGEEILHLDGVHLGIAAQTDRGLVVPAVRDAHRLGMRGLHAEIGRVTALVRDGGAAPAGSSFTLNNYGVLGVDGSAAIINHPEVAILGLGRIIPRPWVVDGEVVARRVGQLSLVFDHRVCDGGTAGGFLRFVADAVENPVSALADL